MNSLSLQLAWRFRRSKRQTGFQSFISASSTWGIALGCLVMILLLSVMNGFERELKDRLLAVLPHGELIAVEPTGIVDWQQQIDRLSADARIQSVHPITKMTGMVKVGAKMKAVEVTGIDAGSAKQGRLQTMLSSDSAAGFADNDQGILLGKGVMRQLGVEVGQQVQLLLPQLSEGERFKAPKSVWFTVVGQIGIGGELDNHVAMVHLARASEILGVVTGAQGLEFSYADPYQAPMLMREFGFAFEQHVYISDWTRTHGHLYQDIQLVRMVVYLALTLLIAVACFNIVSSLVMAVNEKRAEIAMLKTMGAGDGLIIKIFMLQGLLNGVIGTLVGCILGVLLSWRLSSWIGWLEEKSGFKLLSGDIYFIDFLPSELHSSEVLLVAGIALLLSLLATLYPAFKAARIEPAKVLGH
ncbi:lipoprotein-releasing ABC transporter permease subunit LolE [Aliiglaciecola sp. CAU 1673]|uniref:lipoprotein-releasing ABC transporter permease subunit LolE n=1 Tax=Aliiglaciecola sp. CAU 1673 TaxID=3032595 RepID=UPI0023DB4477|nr:lipoprotein-releasing ABC transporter permease subunit LolE [Aliiglaciecola sp. CAU 1673]MDF2178836.1 lipoprotein-releasing ABC transporter permease subunit LolE [Aliiglaciecola sp. CAU 1673]